MNELIMGDCLDAMPTLPEGCADAVIADIPYGTTECKWDAVIPFNEWVKTGKTVEYKEQFLMRLMLKGVPLAEAQSAWLDAGPRAGMWQCIKHVIKPKGAVVLFGSQPFTSALIMSNPAWFKYEIVWEKSIGALPLLCKVQPRKVHENIMVFCDGRELYNPQMEKGKLRDKAPRMFGNKPDENWGRMRDIQPVSNINDLYYPRSVQSFPNAGQADKAHPTQKPLALMEYLINTYTNPGETVMDFTAGSGTTAVAAHKTGRDCIAIEKDAEYFSIMQKRMEQIKQQAILEL